MTKPDIWMPLYIDDYLGDTQLLTVEQHGAYLLLLMACWRNGGWLPDNDAALSAASHLGRGWRKHRGALQGFFEIAEGRWIQKRLLSELEKADRMAETSRRNGRMGGRPPNPDRTQDTTQKEPAGFSPGSSAPRAGKNPDVTREETPARVEGGWSLQNPDSVSPSQGVAADSQDKALAPVISLGRGSGR